MLTTAALLIITRDCYRGKVCDIQDKYYKLQVIDTYVAPMRLRSCAKSLFSSARVLGAGGATFLLFLKIDQTDTIKIKQFKYLNHFPHQSNQNKLNHFGQSFHTSHCQSSGNHFGTTFLPILKVKLCHFILSYSQI